MKDNKTALTVSAFAGAAAACAAAAFLTTRLLVRTALDREAPQIMKKREKRISGKRIDPGFEEARFKAQTRLEARVHETVAILGDDSVRLIGHFYPCENAKRVIIAFHGWRSSWSSDYGLIADFLHRNECSVLYAEQRGQNNSGGDYMGFGLTERFDCVQWANWAAGRCGTDVPIYLAGVSMGASTVLMATALDLPPSVRGIIADCGFTSPKAIWRHVAHKNLHILFGLRGVIADYFCKSRINMESDEYSTLDALRRTDIPVLFIHGSDDSFVPVEMTYENYKACSAPKRLFIVPGADHAGSCYVNPHGYERALISFWHDFDN